MKEYVIKNISDVKNALKKEKVVVFGLGGFPSTRSEISHIAPDFEVITLNKTGEFESIQEKTTVIFFSKEQKNKKIVKKPGELINNPDVLKHIKKKAGKKKVGIYIYKATREIELACNENGWDLIANPPSVFEKVSSKKTFFDIISKLKYPRAFELTTFSELEKNLDRLFTRFGKKIVVQMMDEGGGRGTFFLNTKDKQNLRKKFKERLSLINRDDKLEELEFVVSPFIDGPALSIMGCVTRDNGVLSLYSQYQLIDIKEVTGKKEDVQGGFCGHDWSLSKNIPDKVNKKAKDLAEAIGQELKKMGHLGIFCLDFMLDKKTSKVFPLEINTRILGSFPAIVYTQYQKNEVPLISFHILDFLNIKYKIKNISIFQKGASRKGAHIILFNPNNYDVACTNPLRGGVYKIFNNHLEFLRLGSEFSDIKKENEFILTEGVPIKNKLYKKNRKLLKILAIKSISKKEGKELNTFGEKIVNQVYKNLKLKPYE